MSLSNLTPSMDVNEFIALRSKLSVIIVFAMKFSPEGVLINPSQPRRRCLIFLRWLKFPASIVFNCAENSIIKDVKEWPICCNDGSWCNLVCASLNFANTKSPLNAAGWTDLTGFPRHENICNIKLRKVILDTFPHVRFIPVLYDFGVILTGCRGGRLYLYTGYSCNGWTARLYWIVPRIFDISNESC